MAVPSSSTRLARAILTRSMSSAPSCASTIGMFSRCASSSIRARTGSRGGNSPSMYACSWSVTSTVLIAPLILQQRCEQRLEGHDVIRHKVDGAVHDALIELRGRQRLVQTGPAAVPRLELSVRQLRLDLDHPDAKEIECLLVLLGRPLEVEADLEAARTGVVPRFVMELGPAVVELHKAASASCAVERPQRGRQLRFQPLAQPAEKVRRTEYERASQPAEYIS